MARTGREEEARGHGIIRQRNQTEDRRTDVVEVPDVGVCLVCIEDAMVRRARELLRIEVHQFDADELLRLRQFARGGSLLGVVWRISWSAPGEKAS